MSPTLSLKDIESLPYHALQAEAARHSVRRNLGAAKLREALKELLGNNPDPKKLPPQWFIAATNPTPSNPQDTHLPRPTQPIRTNARIKSTSQNLLRVPLLPNPSKIPPARRTKNASTTKSIPQSSIPAPHSIPEPSSQITDTSADPKPVFQPRLNRENPSSEINTPSITSVPLIHNPTSPEAITERNSGQNGIDRCLPRSIAQGETSRGLVVPLPDSLHPQPHPAATGGPSLHSSDHIFPQAIRDEADRLGLSNCSDERNIQFLTHLVRDTLEELHRSIHVSCTLHASNEPIEFITSRAPPSSRTKTYHNNQTPSGCAEIPPQPSLTHLPSPSSEQPQPGQTEKSDTAISEASIPIRHPGFYVSTPANSVVFQPPRILSPSLSKALNPSADLEHSPVIANTHGLLHSHPDQTSESIIPVTISPDQPLRSSPPSFQAPPIIPGPFQNVNAPSGRPGGIQSSSSAPDMILPDSSPIHDPFTSPHRVIPLRHKSRDKRGKSIDQEELETHQLGSHRPHKKMKLDSPAEQADGYTNPSNLELHQNAIASPSSKNQHPTLSQIKIPSYPLKLFRSPPKAHSTIGRMILDRVSPVSSPAGPTSNPTLFGTEHYYGDSSSARFSEMFLRGSSKLLPSPLNKNNNNKKL